MTPEGGWKPATIDDLIRTAEMFKKPMPCELQMNHSGYELLRDELPVVSDRLRLLGATRSALTDLRIVIVDDMEKDRIAVVDQYGKLLDVIMLPSVGD